MDNIIGIGLTHFATRTEALKFERAAARGLAEDARIKKDGLRAAMNCIETGMWTLLDCRVNTPAIADALAILIDAVTDADHAYNRDIDAASEHFDPIDLTEARAMLDGLPP